MRLIVPLPTAAVTISVFLFPAIESVVIATPEFALLFFEHALRQPTGRAGAAAMLPSGAITLLVAAIIGPDFAPCLARSRNRVAIWILRWVLRISCRAERQRRSQSKCDSWRRSWSHRSPRSLWTPWLSARFLPSKGEESGRK